MKRLFIATGIFGLGIFLLLLPTLIQAVRFFVKEEATGIGFVAGGLGENLFRAAFLALLIFFSYWLSGRLVRT